MPRRTPKFVEKNAETERRQTSESAPKNFRCARCVTRSPAEKVPLLPSGRFVYRAVAGAVVGRKHLRAGVPCQDAAIAESSPRPFLIVADGRGSAEYAHIGARESCSAIAEVVQSADAFFRLILDGDDADRAEILWSAAVETIFEAARVRQQTVAENQKIPQRDLEHTLLVLLLGSKRLGFVHVGDGAIVVEDSLGLRTLSAPERGEYANVTCFVGEQTRPEQIRSDLVPNVGLVGVAAMTDGAAERLIHCRTHEPAPGVSQLFQLVREGRFNERDLFLFLTENFWEPHVQDDRALALLVPSNVPLPATEKASAGASESASSQKARRGEDASRPKQAGPSEVSDAQPQPASGTEQGPQSADAPEHEPPENEALVLSPAKSSFRSPLLLLLLFVCTYAAAFAFGLAVGRWTYGRPHPHSPVHAPAPRIEDGKPRAGRLPESTAARPVPVAGVPVEAVDPKVQNSESTSESRQHTESESGGNRTENSPPQAGPKDGAHSPPHPPPGLKSGEKQPPDSRKKSTRPSLLEATGLPPAN